MQFSVVQDIRCWESYPSAEMQAAYSEWTSHILKKMLILAWILYAHASG